jgi:hypothetical protein
MLRRAFMAMCKDREYQAEAVKVGQPIGEPLDGNQLAAMLDELVAAATPDIVAAYKRLGAAK